jgi:hypothetical protein
VIGDDAAHRRALERDDVRVRAYERSTVADLPLDGSKLVDDDVAALQGYVEAEGLCDEAGRKLLGLPRARLQSVFRALHEEHDRRAKGGQ